MDKDASAERWYAFCCRFLTAPGDHRPRVSRQTLAHYRRIQRLPRAMGEQLDRLDAPFHVLRWIAWASTDVERGARYSKALDRRQHTGRWPSWRHLSEGGKSACQSLAHHSDSRI
jgi:hypothetical protein